jgi:hypothetical protein
MVGIYNPSIERINNLKEVTDITEIGANQFKTGLQS